MTESPFTESDLAAIRAQLPAVTTVAYLNAGSLGPLPQVSVDAMDAERAYDVDLRQGPEHWDRLMELQQQAREELARLTGVEARQVALMHSTHEGLSACVWGMGLMPGDNVVTTDEEHPGLLVPLRHARARLGCDIRDTTWVDDDQLFVDGVLAQVDERTRAILLSHVSWMTGRTAPLRMLRDALPDHVRLVVDGAQSAGVMPVDSGDGWDAYTVSGQKWTCGPNGSGALALADPEAWQSTYGAYMQVADFDDIVMSDLVPDGRRLEMSQEALTPLAGIAASVRWLVDDVGIARARAHAKNLNARARTRLSSAGIDPSSLHGDAHLLALDVRAGTAPELSGEARRQGFLIRPLGDDRIRCSFGAWNTSAEVDGCVDVLLSQLRA